MWNGYHALTRLITAKHPFSVFVAHGVIGSIYFIKYHTPYRSISDSYGGNLGNRNLHRLNIGLIRLICLCCTWRYMQRSFHKYRLTNSLPIPKIVSSKRYKEIPAKKMSVILAFAEKHDYCISRYGSRIKFEWKEF